MSFITLEKLGLLQRTMFDTGKINLQKLQNSKSGKRHEHTLANRWAYDFVEVEFAIIPGRPIFTKSTLINISGLPARLNLSSACCNLPSLN